jgi:hypothetical protein
MAKPVKIEEFHVSLYVPISLLEREAEAILEVITSREFRRRLHRSLAAWVARFAELKPVRIRVTR